MDESILYDKEPFCVLMDRVNPTKREEKSLTFEFSLKEGETIVVIFIKTKCRYNTAKIYGISDGKKEELLLEDDRLSNTLLSEYYVPTNRLPAYRNMVGISDIYSPAEDHPDNGEKLFYIPITIPIHTSLLESKDYFPMTDIAERCLKAWSSRFKKFKISYDFPLEPSETPELYIRKVVTVSNLVESDVEIQAIKNQEVKNQETKTEESKTPVMGKTVEKEHYCYTVEVTLDCDRCKTEMEEYQAYPYHTYQYYYRCKKCGNHKITDVRYPLIKHIRAGSSLNCARK